MEIPSVGSGLLDNLRALWQGSKDSANERVVKVWDLDREARRPRERQAQTNISYYLGNQHIGWNAQSLSVEDLKAPSYRVQSVNNVIFVKVRSKITRMLSKYGVQVLPMSNENKDIRIAKYKERILNHLERELKIDRLKYVAALWTAVTGDCYLEAFWDESAGDQYLDDGGAISTGEIGLRVRSLYEVWPAATASIDNWGGRCWVADILPIEIARAKYGKDITPDAENNTDYKLRARLSTMFGGTDTVTNEKNALEDMIVVMTLYEFRSIVLPSGRISTVINGKVKDEKEMQYFPLVHISNMPNFSSWYGDTELRQAISRQKSLNRGLSSVEEYLRVMKGKWLVHQSTKIRSHQIDSEHGEKIVWSGGGPAPVAVAPPPMPPDTWNLISQNAAAMDDLFSDHAASQGKAKASTSGTAINYMVEEDQRQHMGTQASWETGWERIYEKMLDVAAVEYPKHPDRQIMVVGEDRRADIVILDPEMMKGRNRVMIVQGSSLPQSKVLRSEIIRRNYMDGLYGDPTMESTRRKALKMLDSGTVDSIYDDEALDEIRAEKENEAMLKGELVAPDIQEDHAVHGVVHKRFMKTDTYYGAEEKIKFSFEAHLAMHNEMGAAQSPLAQMAVQQGMAGSGAPPQPGMPQEPGAGGPPPNIGVNQAKGMQNPASSPAVRAPDDMAKSAGQAAGPPPAPGAPQPQ